MSLVFFYCWSYQIWFWLQSLISNMEEEREGVLRDLYLHTITLTTKAGRNKISDWLVFISQQEAEITSCVILHSRLSSETQTQFQYIHIYTHVCMYVHILYVFVFMHVCLYSLTGVYHLVKRRASEPPSRVAWFPSTIRTQPSLRACKTHSLGTALHREVSLEQTLTEDHTASRDLHWNVYYSHYCY